MTDVVVSGVGVASPVLNDPDDILGEPVADASFDPAAALGRGVRYKDRASQLAMVATGRALADGSLVDPGLPRELTVSGQSLGVVASSNLGNLDTVCRTAESIATGSVTDTSPMALPNASSNIVASSIAVRFGIRGPNLMVCNGASSGLDAAHLGALLITSGRVSRVVVVGVEPVNEVVATLVGLPAHELFDGAVAVLLESAAAALARDADARARLGGYARRAGTAASVIHALGGTLSPGLWLTGPTPTTPAALREVPRKDLEAALGKASGALGVLQIAAGVRWLDNRGAEPVLATAGATDDGVSSLVLARTGAESSASLRASQ